jgi:hypothetical protein
VATVAFVAAMEILEQSPPIRRVTGKWRQREMRVEYQRQDRFMRRLLQKRGLLPSTAVRFSCGSIGAPVEEG